MPGQVSPREARAADVAELRVVAAEHGAATHDQSNTNTRADRDVGEVPESAGCAPAAFGERRAIDVGVDFDRYAAVSAQPAADIGAFPTRLDSSGDVAKRPRLRPQIQWPERGEPEGLDRAMNGLPSVEDQIDARQRGIAVGSRYGDFPAHVVGARADDADTLVPPSSTPARSRLLRSFMIFPVMIDAFRCF